MAARMLDHKRKKGTGVISGLRFRRKLPPSPFLTAVPFSYRPLFLLSAARSITKRRSSADGLVLTMACFARLLLLIVEGERKWDAAH